LQTRELKLLRRTLAGKRAGERRQKVALLRQLLQQRRQQDGCLSKLGFLRRDIESAGIPLRELGTQYLKHIGIDGDELACCVDLRTQGCLLNGGSRCIRAQCDMRRRQRETFLLGLRL
jgi:hypothetical protein